MTTIRATLTDAKERLIHSDTAALDAQVLLCHVLQVERVHLFAHDDDILTTEQATQFDALLERRITGEPIAYILGKQGFYDLTFDVTPDVLIPRPETELLLEDALRLMADKPDCVAVDIGTGSGALAVTFQKHMPRSTVYAVDLSKGALAIANKNCHTNEVDVTLLHGNLAQPLIERGILAHLVMANLPYIRSDVMPELAVTQHEPHMALDGGTDGLDFIRELFDQLPAICHGGAWVLLEIGADQGDALQTLVREQFDLPCDILQDYAGLDRIGRFQMA